MERSNIHRLRGDGSGGETMIFVGQARLPQSLASIAHEAICVELEIDPASGRVVGLGSQGVMSCCGHLLEDVLLGRSLDSGLEAALQEIQRRFVGPPQKAVCAAIANAYEAFLRYCRQGAGVPCRPSAASHPDGSSAS